MRQYLLPPEGRFYKANLHCHSSVSDAGLSPRELKEAYKAKGYSVLAITDHEWMVPHPELNDPDFLTITAYEMTVRDGTKTTPDNRIVHMNLYAKDPSCTRHSCFDPKAAKAYCRLKAEEVEREELGETADHVYTPEFINRVTREAKENGFLVSFNHPDWGLEMPADYLTYDGFFTVEVYNHSCFMDVGLAEENLNVYDAMLRSGKRLYCTCNDDNHNRKGLDPDFTDSFGGFNMIKAPELTYEAVMRALENGDFYASCGPEIHEMYVEDGYLHIRCSPVRDILLGTSGRKGAHVRARAGETVTEAVFELKDYYQYFRVTLIDREGYKAFSHAWFRDQIRPEALNKISNI